MEEEIMSVSFDLSIITKSIKIHKRIRASQKSDHDVGFFKLFTLCVLCMYHTCTQFANPTQKIVFEKFLTIKPQTVFPTIFVFKSKSKTRPGPKSTS
jgi:hypothetical protein